MELLAKGKKYGKETIKEHTNKVLNELDTFFNIYNNVSSKYLDYELIRLACKYHDAGKANTKFQNKLHEENIFIDKFINMDEVHHGYISPAFMPINVINNLSDDDKKILYQSIYYHHARVNPRNFKDLKIVLTKDIPNLLPDIELNYTYLKYIQHHLNSSIDDKDTVLKYITTKGLLNKCDYAASGGFKVEHNLIDINKHLDTFMTTNKYSYNDLQDYMFENKNSNLIVIGGTGYGKTIAGLRWLDGAKGFFTLPLQVSLNSSYLNCGDSFKMDLNNIGLLHSNSMNIVDKYSKDYMNYCKNLSYSLNFSTIDQIVKCIFKYPNYEVTMSTFSYSKIILDEIQAYTPSLLAYIIVFLKYVNNLGGKFAIITATLPPIFIYFLEKELKIKVKQKVFNKDNKRHVLSTFDKELTSNDVESKFNNNKVLVVVNTVKKAKSLYEELKNKNIEVNLLHSHFTKSDRKQKESTVLKHGKSGDESFKGIWISTQIVEASLDIDFDFLLTELSDISGLLQRLGRCYRSRDYISNTSNVYVYTKSSAVSESRSLLVDKDIFKRSKEVIKDLNNTYVSEACKLKMVEYVYDTEALKGTDYYTTIVKTIRSVKDLEDYSIRKEDVEIRDINNIAVIPSCLDLCEDNIITINISYKKDLIDPKFNEELNAFVVKNKYTSELGLYLN